MGSRRLPRVAVALHAEHRDLHVLLRAQLGQQVVELEHQADLRAAKPCRPG